MRRPGDDAAVVRARPFAVTSIDTVVDGVHFELRHPHPSRRRLEGARDRASRTSPRWAPTPARPTSRSCCRRTSTAASSWSRAWRSWPDPSGHRRSPAATWSAGPVLTVTVAVTGWADARGAAGRPRRRPAGRPRRRHRRARAARRRAGCCSPAASARDDPLARRHLRPEPRLRAGAALAAAGRERDDRPQRRPRHATPRHLAERSGVELRLRLRGRAGGGRRRARQRRPAGVRRQRRRRLRAARDRPARARASRRSARRR